MRNSFKSLLLVYFRFSIIVGFKEFYKVLFRIGGKEEIGYFIMVRVLN